MFIFSKKMEIRLEKLQLIEEKTYVWIKYFESYRNMINLLQK